MLAESTELSVSDDPKWIGRRSEEHPTHAKSKSQHQVQFSYRRKRDIAEASEVKV